MLEKSKTSVEGSVGMAARHALAWWVFGNLAGLWLSLLLMWPSLQNGLPTYGRWIPVHLNVQLYGWTSLPLIAWLLSIYEVDRSKAGAWAPAAIWGWTTALAAGIFQWLHGTTSGKIFLDWNSGAFWAFLLAQVILWHVLASAWNERSRGWSPSRRRWSLVGLVGLLIVPVSLAIACSPASYPPVDVTTGGPTGSSLMGSTLVVIGLALILPLATSLPGKGGVGPWKWFFYLFSWGVFIITEWMGGTHHDPAQIGAMSLLLPWIWILPRDWSGYVWPAGSRPWRMAVFGWWALLVFSGWLMYEQWLLDRIKFTQALVAHSHMAMAGFTTSFCMLLLALLTGRRIGGPVTVAAWHVAALLMVVVLAFAGWKEGGGYAWMAEMPTWRFGCLRERMIFGAVMSAVSLIWLGKWKTS